MHFPHTIPYLQFDQPATQSGNHTPTIRRRRTRTATNTRGLHSLPEHKTLKPTTTTGDDDYNNDGVRPPQPHAPTSVSRFINYKTFRTPPPCCWCAVSCGMQVAQGTPAVVPPLSLSASVYFAATFMLRCSKFGHFYEILREQQDPLNRTVGLCLWENMPRTYGIHAAEPCRTPQTTMDGNYQSSADQ